MGEDKARVGKPSIKYFSDVLDVLAQAAVAKYCRPGGL